MSTRSKLRIFLRIQYHSLYILRTGLNSLLFSSFSAYFLLGISFIFLYFYLQIFKFSVSFSVMLPFYFLSLAFSPLSLPLFILPSFLTVSLLPPFFSLSNNQLVDQNPSGESRSAITQVAFYGTKRSSTMFATPPHRSLT